MSEKWAGRAVTSARAHWLARLPLPCFRCGKPVIPGQRWHVEHIIDRALGGTHGVENQWVPAEWQRLERRRLDPGAARAFLQRLRGVA